MSFNNAGTDEFVLLPFSGNTFILYVLPMFRELNVLIHQEKSGRTRRNVICSAFISRMGLVAFRGPILVQLKSIFRIAYGGLHVFVN